MMTHDDSQVGFVINFINKLFDMEEQTKFLVFVHKYILISYINMYLRPYLAYYTSQLLLHVTYCEVCVYNNYNSFN